MARVYGNVVTHQTPGTVCKLLRSRFTNKDKWLESPLAGNLIKGLGSWRVALNILIDGQESLQGMKTEGLQEVNMKRIVGAQRALLVRS